MKRPSPAEMRADINGKKIIRRRSGGKSSPSRKQNKNLFQCGCASCPIQQILRPRTSNRERKRPKYCLFRSSFSVLDSVEGSEGGWCIQYNAQVGGKRSDQAEIYDDLQAETAISKLDGWLCAFHYIYVRTCLAWPGLAPSL